MIRTVSLNRAPAYRAMLEFIRDNPGKSSYSVIHNAVPNLGYRDFQSCLDRLSYLKKLGWIKPNRMAWRITDEGRTALMEADARRKNLPYTSMPEEDGDA